MFNDQVSKEQCIEENNTELATTESTVITSEIHLSQQQFATPTLEHSNGQNEFDQQLINEAGITVSLDTDKPSIEEVSKKVPRQRQSNPLCEICRQKDWIYTCPRCHIHTCCVACVQKHKLEAPCSGQRDKTAYIPLQKYNESNMMSDYTYLEDVSRQADNVTRSRLNVTRDLKYKNAEIKARSVTKIANSMGIRYSALPVGMSRNKLNQTNYSKNLRQIFWSLEINFCKDNRRERYLEHSFPSNKPFHAFFENLLYAEKPQGKSDYYIIRHQVKEFVQAGIDQFKIALKKEKAPRGHFIDMTHVMDALFRDVLKDEVIIEFPIFYIWLKTDEPPSDILVLEEKKQPLIVPIKTEASKDSEQAPLEAPIKTGESENTEQPSTDSNATTTIE